MPAGVIPHLDVATGIRVEATGRYVAGCLACRWFPDFYFDPEVAVQAAAYHNQVRHDGAPVEDQPEFHPLSVIDQTIVGVKRQERIAKMWALGYVPVIGLLSVFVGFPWWAAIPTLIWGFVLVWLGRSWGQWAERMAYAQTQRETFTVALDRIKEELS